MYNILKEKALQQRPKGWKFSGSPDCNIDRTFIYQFYFQTVVKKSLTPKKTYRNPIYLAREYENIIDSGEAKNQAELARIKGISRSRVTQILSLLKLDSLVIQELVKLGDPLKSRIITERMLRPYVNKSSKEQKDFLYILRTFVRRNVNKIINISHN